MLGRCACTGAVALVFLCLNVSAAAPDLSGRWQVDEAKSKFGEEKTLAINIQQQGNQITLTRTYRDADRKQVSDQFTCAAGGKQCDFDDHGHNAKVSLWYDGPALVLLKTGGEKHDSTVEWHFRLSQDGKTMTINREVMEPSDETETLVFDKADSLGAH